MMAANPMHAPRPPSLVATCQRVARTGLHVSAREALACLIGLLVIGCGGESPLAPHAGADAQAASRPKTAAPVPAAPSPASAPVAPPPPASPPPPPAKPSWQVALEDGIESYENGAYGNAIRKLEDVANNPQASDAARVRALKYVAFSYCVTPDPPKSKSKNTTLCRQAFERALAMNPHFDLTPGERGHPVWGKQFLAARSATLKKARAGSGTGTSSTGPDAAKKAATASSATGSSVAPAGKP